MTRARPAAGVAPVTPAPHGAGVLAFAREAADRAALAEAELAILRERLETLQRFLRHDARTPLTIVLGHAQMLAEGMIPEGRRGESFNIIHRQIGVLGTRMDQLGARSADERRAAVWVRCTAAQAEPARAALAGLPAVVVDEALANLLDLPAERVVEVGEDWTVEGLRADVQRAANTSSVC